MAACFWLLSARSERRGILRAAAACVGTAHYSRRGIPIPLLGNRPSRSPPPRSPALHILDTARIVLFPEHRIVAVAPDVVRHSTWLLPTEARARIRIGRGVVKE